MQALKGMLNSNTKLVATLHVSNVLASVVDVKDLAQAVHAVCPSAEHMSAVIFLAKGLPQHCCSAVRSC